MPLDADRFRDVMGCFATGVAVVTTRDGAGAPVGVTISSFASLSLDPPLVLFCLEWSADCWPAFAAADHFTVNFLAADQAGLSVRFSSLAPDRWSGVAHRPGAAGGPVIVGALGWVACRKEAVHSGGDHAIVVGRVEDLDRDPDRQPLLHFRGRYGAFAG
ncbi:MAG: flavin reductase family protein [Alphaproteobacteria bacterium]